ncbi:YihY/virulence factor BrkB family protein [Haladaptatus paucihalophilus]|uniref:Membrane protein n=1 Tax=Haladaptatus paucihalophilus DX253 TaxID=797209 RepID=A0A1M6YML3_HALPU|nr:YihY/virulence factor BrkB family protein [Haladaptatus paucihalophilus]SHL19332.1 membrane protein [Haladaptatus paucihalophilus DX253]
MNPRLRRVVSLGRDIVREVHEENIKFMAGSIAYHSFVSLLPVLLLLTLIVSAVGSETLARRLIQDIGSYLPASANIFLQNAISGAPSPGDSLVVVLVLLWGTFRIFRALDAAFADIYDVERKTSFRDELEDGVVVLVALVLVVVTIGVTSATISTPQRLPFDEYLAEGVSILVLGIAFLPMYYVFPNIDVEIGEILPGVAIAAVGWQVLHSVFHMYAQVSAYNTSLYGTVGKILLVIVWLYVGSIVILFGAAVNAVLAGRTGDAAKSDRERDSAEVKPTERKGTVGDETVESGAGANKSGVNDTRANETVANGGEAVASGGIESEQEFREVLHRLTRQAREDGLSTNEIQRELRREMTKTRRSGE